MGGTKQMAKVYVNPGICGFKTVITVYPKDIQNAIIKIETQCPNIKPLELELIEIDAFKECFSKIEESKVYELLRKYCKHLSCPIPIAIIKGIEISSELALPCDVEIKITKEI